MEKPSESLALHFDTCLPPAAGVQRKKMFGMPCAFVNDNMFAGLMGERTMVRLSQAERDEWIANRGATPFEARPGQVMREYIEPPLAVVQDAEAFAALLQAAYTYTEGLPPKVKKERKPKVKAEAAGADKEPIAKPAATKPAVKKAPAKKPAVKKAASKTATKKAVAKKKPLAKKAAVKKAAAAKPKPTKKKATQAKARKAKVAKPATKPAPKKLAKKAAKKIEKKAAKASKMAKKSSPKTNTKPKDKKKKKSKKK